MNTKIQCTTSRSFEQGPPEKYIFSLVKVIKAVMKLSTRYNIRPKMSVSNWLGLLRPEQSDSHWRHAGRVRGGNGLALPTYRGTTLVGKPASLLFLLLMQ